MIPPGIERQILKDLMAEIKDMRASHPKVPKNDLAEIFLAGALWGASVLDEAPKKDWDGSNS